MGRRWYKYKHRGNEVQGFFSDAFGFNYRFMWGNSGTCNWKHRFGAATLKRSLNASSGVWSC